MRRRQFISLLGGAVLSCPATAWAQQPGMPAIGMLSALSAEKQLQGPQLPLHRAFLQGLNDFGYEEGRDLTIEYRFAAGQYELLPAMAADLVRQQVRVIVAVAGSAPGLAAKSATSTIPIVFQTGSDPIKDGLVSNMARPGGNVTGITRLGTTVEPKRLELLHKLVPKATTIAFLVNPTNPAADRQLQEVNDAARSLGLPLEVMRASTERELDTVFATLAEREASALIIATDPFVGNERLIASAAHYRVPLCCTDRSQVAAGCLMSYGASRLGSWRQVGIYTGRILKGEKPADLPVLQPTRFELVVNLKIAKALALTIPPDVLAIADDVIE
jgi:putative tryptophan/tyrosine transport system substrate-binding protein